MKYFNDTNRKDFPDYFQNNQILMIKRECLMKWKKLNNEDIVNLQHIFLMSLIDENETYRPIDVKTLLEETINVSVDVAKRCELTFT
ncbi:unnamed protein product [Rotaria sordida]|uniref:Uncharacterized protein n=1 Tax=Rotaria sordida TaxID=392033 RepID=A0A815BDC2_9BILA|nr:unnamed protein product [Rotaria sordida]CAF3720034.1 unnamed protein product [Rotaria sordida]